MTSRALTGSSGKTICPYRPTSYTTNVEGFFGAQREWLRASLPKRAVLLTQDEYGQPVLPKKAECVWGKADKSAVSGYYLDHHSGEVRTIVYRMPPDNKRTTARNTANDADPQHRPAIRT